MIRFWIGAAAWLCVVAAATPALIEMADRRGIGLQMPGLSVTMSEMAIGAALALGPIMAALWLHRRRTSR